MEYDMEQVYAHYISTRDANLAAAKELKRKIHLAGTLRFMIVVACIAAFIAITGNWLVYAAVFLAFAIPFTALVTRSSRLGTRKAYAERMAALCEAELRGLDYDFSAFDGAAASADPAHPFTTDLDVFGDRGLFQSLNRTVTSQGTETLAGWFRDPLSDKSAILERQAAVRELANATALRQHFYVTGRMNPGHRNDRPLLETLAGVQSGFASGSVWTALVWAVPALWALIIAGMAAGIVSTAIAVIYLIVCIVLVALKAKEVGKLHDKTDRMVKVLSIYAHLIRIIEDTPFEARLLAGVKTRLAAGGQTASATVMQLSRILNSLDQRGNILVAIFNLATLRDIRIVQKLDRWKRRNSPHISGWFDALGDFDALCSLAGFAYNHPGYVYPHIAEGYFSMRGRGMGHPLLHRDVCVANDIDIDRHPYFMIVTGANMAGKSTYLRTVGVNFLLACVGAPACAQELAIYPCQLVTSLRTSDSLTDNESYFYAELKRLKMIIERLERGEELFIVLDEILKGTNSLDKQKGSLALIRQFVSYGACGIIATHDLVLGTLHGEFPAQVANYRFEAEIDGDRLDFSYRMRPGVAENMNAFFLMKRMGITV